MAKRENGYIDVAFQMNEHVVRIIYLELSSKFILSEDNMSITPYTLLGMI